jgi:hypothetical protein
MYRLIGVDAPSILYSSVRELVALLTGRSSSKTVLLPTVSFIENVVVPAPEPVVQPHPAAAAEESPKFGAGERRKTADRSRGKAKQHARR